MASTALLSELQRLVGKWQTEATHPALPGIVVKGVSDISWLGERFLSHRAVVDHPDFPDSISIIGVFGRQTADDVPALDADAAPLSMQYFDARGVSRTFDVNIDDGWQLSSTAPAFPQRFSGSFSPDGNTIKGLWEVNENNEGWRADMSIIYRRQ